jgi:hypothetical protein
MCHPNFREGSAKMKSCLLLMLVLLIATLAVPQDRPAERPDFTFHDDLLDHLVGRWDITGIVHGNPSKQTLEAEWVLNHQFLRIYEKSVENVAGTNVPYEGVFFIGYDATSKRYVAHLMNVFGGRDSEGFGLGERSGEEIKFVFKNLDAAVANRFIWEAESKTWHIVGWLENGTGEPRTIMDLRATRAK